VVLQSSALQAMQNQLGELHQQLSRPGLDAIFWFLICFGSNHRDFRERLETRSDFFAFCFLG
jgi:hypothetical protein